MPLQQQTFDELVQNQVTAIQARAQQLQDFSIGSDNLALVESNAFLGLSLEAQIATVFALTRIASSKGADLDSYVNPFGVIRGAATFASGLVTFSRNVNTQQALILVGTQVQTVDQSISFQVYADSTNPNFNPVLNGYVITAGTTSINVPVIALTAGTIGNVGSSTITVILQPIAYVDTVTNNAPFTNAVAQETDDQLRARFILFLNNLSKATLGAVAATILGSQTGIAYILTENKDESNVELRGYFYVVVAIGNVVPPDSLIDSLTNAIELIRPLCSSFAVHPAVQANITVSAAITLAPGYVSSTVAAQVQAAVITFINSITIKGLIAYSQLPVPIFSVPGVLNVEDILLNSGTSDIQLTNFQVPNATISSVTITIN